MDRRHIFVALAVVVASLAVQADDRIFESRSGRTCFVDLLRQGSWGLGGPYERAAFVVEDATGEINCVVWPWKRFYLEEVFRGPMPPGTVALVHTHPVEFPMPSEHDIQEAARLGKPIYVLTIHGVYRADPQSHDVSTVALGRSWIGQIPSAASASRRMAMSAPAPSSP